MADYNEFLKNIDRKLYHEGEITWQEGDYTVTRTHQWSAPGCHDACGILLYTKDGDLKKVEGDPLEPYNGGKLCMRCLNLVEAVHHPDRLKYPLKRVGERGENKWERISWDEAYDIIVEKVNYIKENYGSESIIACHGTARNVMWQHPYFFNAALDTPNIVTMFHTGFACYLPRVVGCSAITGDYAIADAAVCHEDRYANKEWKVPECILIWGNNPLISNADGFLGHWLVQCMQMGSKLIVIDPRVTWLASRAEYHLQLRPGTDAAIACALLNVIISEDLYDHDFVEKWTYGFEDLAKRVAEYPPEKAAEICDVPADKIRNAARFFAKAKPATLQWGLAFEQQVNAMALCVAATDLFAITGNLDVPGGVVLVRNAYNTQRMYNCGEEWLSPGKHAKRLNSNAKGIADSNIVPHASSDVILNAIETGKPYEMKMFWCQSSNAFVCPGMSAPRAYAALKKLEFNVVIDCFMTPTAVACADIVLPVAMGPERNSVRSWWTPLRAMTKACQYYEAKSDEEIMLELGKRLRPEAFPFKDDIEWLEWYITKDGDWPGTFEDLKQKNYAYWDWDATYYKYEKGMLRDDGEVGFNTASGKVELAPLMFIEWGLDPLPFHLEPPESPVSTPELFKEYPIILSTGQRAYEFFHSEHRQMPTMREFHPDPIVEIHPETAKQYDINQGDWIWIENKRGRCKHKANLTVRVKPGVIHAEHAWWFPEKEGAEPSLFGSFDSNINNLTMTCVTGPGDLGAPNKGLLCKIYKVIPGVNDQVSPTEQVVKLGGFKNASR